MKRFWPRILSAFSTLAVGLIAGSVARFAPLPAVKVEPSSGAAEIQVRSTPPALEPAPPPARLTRPRSVSISPFEIKRLIDENNRAALRQQASELDLAPVRTRLMMGDDDAGFHYGKCDGNCEAYIMTPELDWEPGSEVLLRLHAAETWGYCYLIFKRPESAGGDWVLIGHVDTFNRWNGPQQKVTAIGSQRWLVLGRTPYQGTWGNSHANDWYEVGDDGVVVPVLSYQTELSVVGETDKPATKRTTRVLSMDSRDGIDTVVLQVSSSYTSYNNEANEPLRLWSDKRKATFIKGPRMDRFIFDSLRSEVGEKELDPDYPLDGAAITNEEFLKYNYRELLKIAYERWTTRKDWLFEFLKSCGDTVEKQSLLDTAVINNKCRS